MKNVPKYVVVIPQPDGSLYPLKFHSDYDEAVITANNHDKDSKVKSQIRTDGPKVWMEFKEKERQEKNKEKPVAFEDIPNEGAEYNLDEAFHYSMDKDEVSPETKVKLDNLRKLTGKLVEFAEKLEQKTFFDSPHDKEDGHSFLYEFIPNEELKPCGLLFWGTPKTNLLSFKINGQEQLAITGAISVRAFLNPYISIEAVQYWVEKKAKLQYTNLALPSMKPGDKMEVIVDTPCVICACGMKYEVLHVSPGTKS